MGRCLARLVFPLLFLAVPALASTIDGFITRIDSPTEIELGTMHVLITSRTSCTAQVLHQKGKWGRPTSITPCTSQQMIIGSRVVLGGQVIKEGRFIADHLEMREGYQDPCQWCLVMMLHRTAPGATPGVVVHSALNEEAPTITRSPAGWNGMWWVDGYPMSVNAQTKLISAPNSKILRLLGVRVLSGDPLQIKQTRNYVHELKSSRLLAPNTFAFYHATARTNRALEASQILLWPNQISTGEKQFLAMYVSKIKLPDYGKSIPGILQYRYGGPIEIVPDQNVQEYISHLV